MGLKLHFKRVIVVKMGKGPKTNKNGKPRNNAIFKVVGGTFKDKKGKPKEITSKLKSIANKTKSKIIELDTTLQQLQKDSVVSGTSLSGEKISQTRIDPAPVKHTVMDTDVAKLTDLLEGSTST